MARAFLLLVLLHGVQATTRFIVNNSIATATCSGHFSTPCAIATAHNIVDSVVEAILDSPLASASILQLVTGGVAPFAANLNFWATVYDSNGICVASGRPSSPDLSPPVGRHANVIAEEETGFPQPRLWTRIVQKATADDGYYTFSGFDNHNEVAHAANAVSRVGYVRAVTVPGSITTYYVTSAYSDVDLVDGFNSQNCAPQFSTLCAISYVRQITGSVATAMLKAETYEQLQEVLASVTWRQFNRQSSEGSAGFYPFVFSFDPATISSASAGGGTNVAHGANAAHPGRNVSTMLIAAADGDASVGQALGASFAEAALEGGGYVSYIWSGATKISLVVGVRRFGQHYYLGTGTQATPTSCCLALRPRLRCGTCDGAERRAAGAHADARVHLRTSLTLRRLRPCRAAERAGAGLRRLLRRVQLPVLVGERDQPHRPPAVAHSHGQGHREGVRRRSFPPHHV